MQLSIYGIMMNINNISLLEAEGPNTVYTTPAIKGISYVYYMFDYQTFRIRFI